MKKLLVTSILAGMLCLATKVSAPAAEKPPQDRRAKYLALSDEDLFAAMNLDHPGLEKVKAAVEKKDWQAALAAWGKYWSARKSPRYYVEADDYVRGINKHLPDIKKIVIAGANEIFGENYKHGTYQTKRRGRSFQWIDDSPDTAYMGFLYFWCLKNQGRAYLLTGDEKYAVMFREIVCSFWDAVPGFAQARARNFRGFDMFWEGGLASSLRCLHMMDCYWLMRESESFTPELHSKMLRLFLSHSRYIYDTQMASYSHANERASEAAWMVTAGVLFPEFKESSKWRDIGVQRTKQRIVQNFDNDGAQLEQCPQYHLTGIRDITRVLKMLHANGMQDISRDKKLWSKMERVYDYPIRITHPTGHLGLFNSGVYATEAQVFFPVGMRLFGSKLHHWAAARYIRPGFVPVAKNVSEYVNFMDGAWAQTLEKARQQPVSPPTFTNDLMKDSGMAVLRSGWDEKAFSLIFDFQRSPWGSHRYFGRLSFDLFAYGRAMVVNPGSTISYSMPVYHNWCYQTIGHNTVLIHNRSHNNVVAGFVAWHEGQKAVFVSARMDSHGVGYQRSIVSVPGEYFFFFDRLTSGQDKIPLAWLLHSPLEIAKQKVGAIAGKSGKPGMLIVPDSATQGSSEIVLGKGYAAVPVDYHENYKPLDAWRDDVPYLRLNSKTDAAMGGQTYGVLLAPFEKRPPAVEVRTQEVPDATRLQVHSVAIEWPNYRDYLSVDYRKEQPAFSMVRKDKNEKTLWSQKQQ